MAIVKWVLIGLALVLAAYILLYIVCALAVDPKCEYKKKNGFYRYLIVSATHLAAAVTRIKMHISGEKLPEGRFLLVCNHRSNFDPILTLHAFKDTDIAFISKPENFKKPIFGRLMRKCCYLAIDRDNPRNAIVTINKAADLIKNDQTSIGVYPEGTRSKTCELLPFHNGVFKIAQKAKVPIVVMTLRGTESIMKNLPLHRTHVYLDVVEVIPAETVMSEKTAELAERVRTLMFDDLCKKDDANKNVFIHKEEISDAV